MQWAPITGLSDSCSPALQLHLHWEHRTSDGRPVEDIVSSHRVISLDSPQETMVHCTQFKGLTVHGGILLYGGRGLYFLTAVDNFVREFEVILGRKSSTTSPVFRCFVC